MVNEEQKEKFVILNGSKPYRHLSHEVFHDSHQLTAHYITENQFYEYHIKPTL